ncbi:MAG TPA: COX15/CtaA family protein [Frankiaceae bacterium]|nr:COX15/CtaA family protein [Frankiaceae bacterium]
MRLPTVGLTAFRRLTRAGVVLLGLIVVTGGAVRLTGSGLGCPTWPQCGDGSFVTRGAYSGHGWIEFGNRLLTLVVGVLMIALPLVALRLRERRRDLVLLSFGLWLGFVGQAVLGGLTVLFKLHPALVAGHFLLSMALLLDVVVLDARARGGAGRGHPLVAPELRWLTRLLAGVAAAVLVLGTIVTGTGPHSGDTAQARRFGFDVRTVAQLHADAAMVLTGLVVATLFALHLAKAPAPARRWGHVLAGVVVGQAAIGFVQYFLGIPALLVGLHVTGATILWIVTLELTLSLVGRPTPALAAPVPPRADQPAAQVVPASA